MHQNKTDTLDLLREKIRRMEAPSPRWPTGYQPGLQPSTRIWTAALHKAACMKCSAPDAIVLSLPAQQPSSLMCWPAPLGR